MQLGEGVEWALHCCTVLALVPPDRTLPAARLAEFHGVPPAYLAKHLQALAQAGIVESVPGRKGGYRLVRPAARDHAARGRRRGRGQRAGVPVHRDPAPRSRSGRCRRVPRAVRDPRRDAARGGRVAGRARASDDRGPAAASLSVSVSPVAVTKVRSLVQGGASMKVFVTGGTGAIGRFVVPIWSRRVTR